MFSVHDSLTNILGFTDSPNCRVWWDYRLKYYLHLRLSLIHNAWYNRNFVLRGPRKASRKRSSPPCISNSYSNLTYISWMKSTSSIVHPTNARVYALSVFLWHTVLLSLSIRFYFFLIATETNTHSGSWTVKTEYPICWYLYCGQEVYKSFGLKIKISSIIHCHRSYNFVIFYFTCNFIIIF